MAVLKNVRAYIAGEGIRRADILVREGRIAQIAEAGTAEGEEIYGIPESALVSPGFIDQHIHGAGGADAMDATQEALSTIANTLAKEGTTSFLATTMTQTEENICAALRAADEYIRAEHKDGAAIVGIHLEGPFLAKDYKGAMPEYLLRTADVDLLRHYQELAGGYIHYLTVSPEVEGVLEAIPAMCGLGMTVAMGHSGADYDTAWEAIRRGVRAATHTFNAMKLLHQHFPAIMGAALESDIFCEAICDGRHLHPGTVRFLLKCKGLDRVVAITDSIMAAGLPDGDYKLGVNDVVVEDGDAKLKSDHSRAGSTLTLDLALRNLMAFAGLSLPEVLPLLTENPAKLVHADAHVGTLDPGKDADVVLLDENQFVVDTFVKGEKIVR